MQRIKATPIGKPLRKYTEAPPLHVPDAVPVIVPAEPVKVPA